jgi:hypothetical protein
VKLIPCYEMNGGTSMITIKAKVHAQGGDLSWESLCPLAHIPNSSPSQAMFNPNESVLRLL